VPHVAGVSLPILRLFCREHLASHNCDMMARQVFRRLFQGQPLAPLFCGPCAGLVFWGLRTMRRGGPWRCRLAGLLDSINNSWDHMVFLANQGRPILPLTSSFLFVGRYSASDGA
jgi:hypothetical protein